MNLAYTATMTKVWLVPSGAESEAFSDGYSTTSHSLTNMTLQTGTTMVADGIPVWWQEADLSLFPTTTSSSSSSGSISGSSSLATKTNSGISSAATSATSTAVAAASTGLSTGAKAAIGVVIPVVVIAALLGIFFFIRRRKQRTSESGKEHLAGGINEMDGNNWGATGRKPGFSPVEADAENAMILELDSRDPNSKMPQELPLTAAHPTNTRSTSPYRPRAPLGSAMADDTPASEPLLFGREGSPDRGEEAVETGPKSTTQTTMAEKEQKLARLRADIERVRAEKEQVKTLNELETMEEELKREILKQQRDTMNF